MGHDKLTCEQIAELIGAYNDNDLPAETRRRVERHLMRCEQCAYDVQSLRITVERLKGDAGDVIASDAFRARVLRHLYADNPHVAEGVDPATVSPEQFRLPMNV